MAIWPTRARFDATCACTWSLAGVSPEQSMARDVLEVLAVYSHANNTFKTSDYTLRFRHKSLGINVRSSYVVTEKGYKTKVCARPSCLGGAYYQKGELPYAPGGACVSVLASFGGCMFGLVSKERWPLLLLTKTCHNNQ